jgi:MarR family 2-MHQ and catechol resistance regulon transcriptional repressor
MSKATGVYVWLVLMKAHQALLKRAERSIEETGMCFTDFRILEILLHKGPLPVNTVGARTGLTSGSATTAIDRLVTRDLVERVDDPADRRARIVHLTPAGEKLIEKVFAKHAKAMEKAASGLSPRERGELTDLLKRLGTNAKGE